MVKFKKRRILASLGIISCLLFGRIKLDSANSDIASFKKQIIKERVLILKGGDQSKFGPGPRAKADARRNAQSEKSGSGSNIIPGANGFVPQSPYCHYHKSEPSLSCKSANLSSSPFPGSGSNPPPSTSNSDFSKYKGGPSPFENKFDYNNKNHTRENVDFSNERRMNNSYDGHAKDCFGITENRNKQTVENFIQNLRDYIESIETERINGSYRYEIPTYHFKKPDEDLVVTVNATNNEFISVRNATDFQLEKLERDGNLGYDSRNLIEQQKNHYNKYPDVKVVTTVDFEWTTENRQHLSTLVQAGIEFGARKYNIDPQNVHFRGDES